MLQQFYNTPVFRYAILAADDYKEEDIQDWNNKKYDDNFFHQLQKLFAYLDLSERKDYKPLFFCRSFMWDGERVNVGIQQDSTEFTAKILDMIENYLMKSPYKTIMDSIYQGSTINWMQCHNCKYERVRPQSFYTCSLEVKNLKNIDEGFSKRIEPEEIDDFMCEECKQRSTITKREFIGECPNVMIVCLTRMIFDLEVFMNVKLNSKYDFPLKMNIKKYTKDYFDDQRRDENSEEPLKTKDDEHYDYE